MGSITEQVHALLLTETSPDGLVEGVHTGIDGVTLSFRPGHYRHYTERALEPQLGALFTRLTAAYRRAHAEILARVTGRQTRYFLDPPPDPDARTNRLRAELAETVSQGMSPRGLVYLESAGLVRWRAVIRDGALDKVDEDELAREAVSAHRALLDDNRTKLSALREKHYGGKPTRGRST